MQTHTYYLTYVSNSWEINFRNLDVFQMLLLLLLKRGGWERQKKNTAIHYKDISRYTISMMFHMVHGII